MDKKSVTHQLLSIEEIHKIAFKILAKLPENLLQKLENVILRVENFPSEHILNELGIDNKYDLLGLYSGIPFFKKNNEDFKGHDTLLLYRAPIMHYQKDCMNDVENIIQQVIIHEIGHHFMVSKTELSLALSKN